MKNIIILTAVALTAVAEDFFERYPAKTECFVTEDGQPFFLENRAALHATRNEIDYKKYKRAFDAESANDTPKNDDSTDKESVTAIIAKIPELTGEQLQAYLDQ